MAGNIITDGYTRDAFIAGVERQHGPLRFKFRPMLPEETETFCRPAFLQAPPKQSIAMMAAALKQHVVSWDEDAEITVDNLRRVPWKLLQRLFNVVAGFDPSDPLPEGVGEGEDWQRLLEARGSGRTPGAVGAEADEKN